MSFACDLILLFALAIILPPALIGFIVACVLFVQEIRSK